MEEDIPVAGDMDMDGTENQSKWSSSDIYLINHYYKYIQYMK